MANMAKAAIISMKAESESGVNGGKKMAAIMALAQCGGSWQWRHHQLWAAASNGNNETSKAKSSVIIRRNVVIKHLAAKIMKNGNNNQASGAK
jgi:hypothetical protein